jgi:hypothetical protein
MQDLHHITPPRVHNNPRLADLAAEQLRLGGRWQGGSGARWATTGLSFSPVVRLWLFADVLSALGVSERSSRCALTPDRLAEVRLSALRAQRGGKCIPHAALQG